MKHASLSVPVVPDFSLSSFHQNWPLNMIGHARMGGDDNDES